MYTVQESENIKKYMVKGLVPPLSFPQGTICPGSSTFQLVPCLVPLSVFMYSGLGEKNSSDVNS